MEEKKLERCGFCGDYFIGSEYVSIVELKKLTQEQLDKAPLGYCPNAEGEQDINEQTGERRVTRDMAIDACDLSLEGQPF